MLGFTELLRKVGSGRSLGTGEGKELRMWMRSLPVYIGPQARSAKEYALARAFAAWSLSPPHGLAFGAEKPQVEQPIRVLSGTIIFSSHVPRVGQASHLDHFAFLVVMFGRLLVQGTNHLLRALCVTWHSLQ